MHNTSATNMMDVELNVLSKMQKVKKSQYQGCKLGIQGDTNAVI